MSKLATYSLSVCIVFVCCLQDVPCPGQSRGCRPGCTISQSGFRYRPSCGQRAVPVLPPARYCDSSSTAATHRRAAHCQLVNRKTNQMLKTLKTVCFHGLYLTLQTSWSISLFLSAEERRNCPVCFLFLTVKEGGDPSDSSQQSGYSGQLQRSLADEV